MARNEGSTHCHVLYQCTASGTSLGWTSNMEQGFGEWKQREVVPIGSLQNHFVGDVLSH